MELIIIVVIILSLLWFFGLIGGLRQEAAAWGDRALKQSKDLREKAAIARLKTIREHNTQISEEDIKALSDYNEFCSKLKALDL